MSLLDRVCRECDRHFQGGPRAYYCPDCRVERQREQSRRSKARQRQGLTRQIGSEVFANDVQKAQTILKEGCFGVYSKTEVENTRIGEKRKKYIVEFVELVLDGWGPFQAEYQLASKYL